MKQQGMLIIVRNFLEGGRGINGEKLVNLIAIASERKKLFKF